jgi:hypothetical protein
LLKCHRGHRSIAQSFLDLIIRRAAAGERMYHWTEGFIVPRVTVEVMMKKRNPNAHARI